MIALETPPAIQPIASTLALDETDSELIARAESYLETKQYPKNVTRIALTRSINHAKRGDTRHLRAIIGPPPETFTSTQDGLEQQTGVNALPAAAQGHEADSGQVEENPEPKPDEKPGAESGEQKSRGKKQKLDIPNRHGDKAKSIDEIITSGGVSRELRKYLDESGGSPEDYKIIEEMEAREAEAREAMLHRSLGPNEDNPEYRALLERMATDQAIAKEEWEQDVIAQMAMKVAMSKTVWTGNDQYLFEVKPGDWAKAGHKQLRKLYRESGMFSWIYRLEKDSEKQKELEGRFFEKATDRIMTERKVDIVTELAGYKEQVFTHRGKKILITGHPEIIQPVKGEFPTIQGVLSDLLQTEQQLNLFFGWLKTSYEALADGEMRPGPAMVLVGPKGIFKSGCKELIIRPILGGRNAEPLKNMKGNQFNNGIAGAESWEFDDISSTPDAKERKLFGDGLKRYTSTTEINVEGKFKDSFQSPPLFYRPSMYLNDEKQDLWALPQMTKSLRGKVIALQTYGRENRKVRLPTTNTERQAFREVINRELPAFVYWLVNEFEIPKELQDSRYGIAGWIHPDIEEKLNASSDEARLQRLVDVVIFDRQNLSKAWEGKYSDMETQLLVAARDLHRETELRKILWYDGAFYDLLKKMKAMPGSRVGWKHTRGGNIWVWAPPPNGQQERGEVHVDVDFTVLAA